MDLSASIVNQTDVSLSLAKHLISTLAKDTNFVFSPFSMHVVLGMIAAGSKGPTQDQLLGFLKSKSTEQLITYLSSLLFTNNGGPHLSFANGIWVDQSVTLKPSFKEVIENAFKAVSARVDFQTKAVEARKEVNRWAEKQTNGLIEEILPPDSVDDSTRLILANTVYFKGAWNEKFDASNTRNHDFFLLNGRSIQVPFMTTTNKQYIRAFKDFKVLGLPYKQELGDTKFSMYIFLPDANDGLPSLLEKVCSESNFIERHLPYQEINVGHFRIPKFKINFGFEASEVFMGLGLVLPFSSGDCDISEMLEDHSSAGIYVSKIFHESFIEVNEEETKAASATAAVFLRGAMFIKDTLNFVADHPFLFIIREDTTGLVLFLGQVLNPLVVT